MVSIKNKQDGCDFTQEDIDNAPPVELEEDDDDGDA